MIQPSEDTHTYSVVVPVFDSEGTLEELYQRLTNVMAELLGADGRYELVFVDDASPGARTEGADGRLGRLEFRCPR